MLLMTRIQCTSGAWWMYIKQVCLTVLLQFQHTTRESNWFLYLAALEKLCVYFAYNWVDYIYMQLLSSNDSTHKKKK